MRRLPAVSLAVFAAIAATASWLHVAYETIGHDGSNVPMALSLIACFSVFAVVGTVIVSRRPDHAIGRIYVVGALLGVLGSLASGLVIFDRAGGTAPLVAWWLIGVLGVLPLIVLVPIPLLVFPSGKLPSKRWRPVLAVAVLGVVALMAQPALLDQRFGDPPNRRNPIGVEGANELLTGLNTLGLLALVLVVAITVVSLFRRYRRATGAEREQYRWLAWAGVWTIVLVFIAGPGTYGEMFGAQATRVLIPWTPFIFALSIAAVPTAIAVAILRYHLWDIGRIVSRTVSYAIVTAIIVGIYAVVAIVVPSRFVAGDSTPDALIAAGTLLAAGAFGPVRSRVQARVDHRFNRARYDATRTIDAFTARLRENVDLDTLAVELEGIVDRTMRPAHLHLWLAPR